MFDYKKYKNLSQEVESEKELILSLPHLKPTLVDDNDNLNVDVFMDLIGSHLSPERLSCDGEAPKRYINQQLKYWHKCIEELESLTGRKDIKEAVTLLY